MNIRNKNQSKKLNIDLICEVLAEVTNRPAQLFRRNILAAVRSGQIPQAKLFEPVKDPTLYEKLQEEKSGILNWILEGRAGILG